MFALIPGSILVELSSRSSCRSVWDLIQNASEEFRDRS